VIKHAADRPHRRAGYALPKNCRYFRALRYAMHCVPNQGNAHLPPHGQPAGSAVSVWRRKIESTVRYLGIEVDDALAIAEQVDV
jgi:hypothetical protein